MLKKWLIGFFALSMALSMAACGQTNNDDADKAAVSGSVSEEAPADEPAEEASAEDPALELQKAFNAAAMAEGKVHTLFAKDTYEDEATGETTPLLNLTTGTPEAARELLLKYFDAALADQIMTHYITDKTIDAGIVVNAEPFFTSTLQGLKFEDVTVEGTKEAATITTKDNVVYTVSWNEEAGKYIVMSVEKK
ncbi:hypothetical protein [Paenibacillus thermotolerans]|uniref:hypothetical protein n=1 Tax=Paenibacillus thermotolerans TaxID=3027807 RepID=UPI0023676025|nr:MULTISPECIES: hypothetical protein [unclassified Paenibacillus]